METAVVGLPPGTLVGERYKLLGVHGRGGFGITYAAWDTQKEERVAVKECFPQEVCVRDAKTGAIQPACAEWEPRYLKALESMRKEVETLSSLRHPAVVQIRDVIWGNGSVFCVMSWLSGGTLKERMEQGTITREKSLEWLNTLLDALRYLHGRGVYHRDIKPGNIMFDASDAPVIIDFGAALNRGDRTTASTTSQGEFSRNYAAPEQITGKGEVGAWTDIYALSATWYELLTGVRPESSDARLMRDGLKPLTGMPNKLGYPEILLALLERNMSLLSASRCQSVDQWRQCVEDGVLPALVQPGKRRRRILIAIGVLAALGLGGLCGVYLAIRGDSTATAAEQMPAVGLRKQLIARVESEIQAQEYRKLCEQYTHRINQLHEEHKKLIRRMDDRYRTDIAQAGSEDALETLRKRLWKEARELDDRMQGEARAIYDEFMEKGKGYSISSSAMQARVQPRNHAEEIILPVVCEELAQELGQCQSNALIRWSSQDAATVFSDAVSRIESAIDARYDALMDRQGKR